MTMPDERTRAVIQTRDFLIELSKNAALPERVRNDAKFLLRHFPSKDDMRTAGLIEERCHELPTMPIFSSAV